MQAPARITSARFGWRPDDPASFLGRDGTVPLDLPVHLGPVDDRPLDPVGIVAGHPEHHGREVRHRAAHAHQGVRAGGAVDRPTGRRRSRRAPAPAPPGRRPGRGETSRCTCTAPTFRLNCRSTRVPVAEGELAAPAAGVEDHRATVAQPEPRLHGEVGDPALVRAGDDLDRDAALLLDQVEERLAVGGGPQAHRADGRDAVGPSRVASSAIPAIASAVRSMAAGAIAPVSWMPSPRRRDLGTVGDRGPGAVGLAFGDVELDRVGPHVDHRLASSWPSSPPRRGRPALSGREDS